MARACKTPEFCTVSCPHWARFRRLVAAFFNLYGLRLPLPVFGGTNEARLSLFKKFCSGLLEKRSHLWDSMLRGGSDQRHSIAVSLFLFRKTLPSDPPDVQTFLKKMSSSSPEPDRDFLDFCQQEVPRLFRRGWDRDIYSSSAISSVLSTSSCVENGRKGGGVRGWVSMGNSSITGREGFILSTLTMVEPNALPPSRVIPVETGGKWRLISVPGAEMSLLSPLHKSMYNHLSRNKWLLRGDAKPSKFNDFTSCPGEMFVSGDYESATDNLNQDVQKEILRLVLQNSTAPSGIKLLAMRSLSLKLVDGNDSNVVFDQKRGQMMGNLLSFPLLCLVNYLCFKWSIPRDVPCRINGDDIVFRSTEAEYNRWKNNVSSSGLTLSEGKTMISKRYFTLNSTLFKGVVKGAKLIPFIRSKSLFPLKKDKESILTLQGRMRSAFPGYSGARKSFLRTWFLKENRDIIEASNRSLKRGLELPVKLCEVIGAGLWFREAWYLSFEVEKPLPSRYSEWMRKPEGWQYYRVEKVTKEDRARSKEVAMSFVEAAWLPSCGGSDYDWEEDLVGSYSFSVFEHQRRYGLRKRARLLGLSPRNACRYLKPKVSVWDRVPSIHRIGVWRPCADLCSTTVRKQEPREAVRGDIRIAPPSCLTS